MDTILQGLATGSPIAGVLAWALWYIGKEQRENRAAIVLAQAKNDATVNRLVRADLLRLVASPHVSREVKDEATTIIKEIDEETKK